jgi:hypothetical protein
MDESALLGRGSINFVRNQLRNEGLALFFEIVAEEAQSRLSYR